MRVAYVTAVYPPVRGGMCTVAAAEAGQLGKFQSDVVVFTLASGDSRKDMMTDRMSDAPVVRLTPLPRISISGFVPQLFFMLLKFDVVYAHLPAYGFLEVLLLWKLITRRRLVVTVHMDPVGTGWMYAIGFALQRLTYRMVLRCADQIRVSTDRMAETPFLKKYSEKISVIPFGIDLKQFSPVEKKEKHIYLFVGRLSRTHYFKGVELLLRAFKQVTEQDQDSELWIVGDGEERARYEKLAAEKIKLGRRVKFLGAVTDEELPNIYREASIVVLPSIDTSETFGLVLLEAMASGVPVIASRLPGVDALVRDHETGTLIEPGSEEELAVALVDASVNRVIWKQRAHAARLRAEEFGDWTEIAARVSTLL